MIFAVFLETVAFLLSVLGIALIYMAIKHCKKSEFVPIYYFMALSLGTIIILSGGRIASLFYESFILSSVVIQDLLIAYVALFLFGALWQSYEASMCRPPYVDVEE